MEPSKEEVQLLNQKVDTVRSLAKQKGIPIPKLNLDYYEFEVSMGKVKDGICLYYSECPSQIKASKEHIWYTKNLAPISLEKPNWTQELPAYLKLLMGGRGWYKEKHHLCTIGRAKPSGFYGARMASRGQSYALFFKLPRNTRLYHCSPSPIECYAENDRLNLLFLLTSEYPKGQPRSLDIHYEIPRS